MKLKILLPIALLAVFYFASTILAEEISLDSIMPQTVPSTLKVGNTSVQTHTPYPGVTYLEFGADVSVIILDGTCYSGGDRVGGFIYKTDSGAYYAVLYSKNSPSAWPGCKDETYKEFYLTSSYEGPWGGPPNIQTPILAKVVGGVVWVRPGSLITLSYLVLK